MVCAFCGFEWFFFNCSILSDNTSDDRPESIVHEQADTMVSTSEHIPVVCFHASCLSTCLFDFLLFSLPAMMSTSPAHLHLHTLTISVFHCQQVADSVSCRPGPLRLCKLWSRFMQSLKTASRSQLLCRMLFLNLDHRAHPRLQHQPFEPSFLQTG